MRWIITFLLIIAVATAGAVLFEDTLRSAVGIPSQRTITAQSPSLQALAIAPDAISKIELKVYDEASQSEKTLSLMKSGKEWTQPGNWALREKEVTELIDALTTLTTRFVPIRLEGDAADLKKYGLDSTQHPTAVAITLPSSMITLRFGSDLSQSSPASIGSAYLRVDEKPEVIRLTQDVLRVISRSPEDYRRKQLFPDAPRVRLTGETGPLVPILADGVKQATVRTPAGTYTLTRLLPTPPARRPADRTSAEPGLRINELAMAWQVSEPEPDRPEQVRFRDRPDPAKLRTVLSAIPDLWADAFTTTTDADASTTGLDKPEREIRLVTATDNSMVLKIGNVSRTVTRDGPPAGPPMGPFPPMASKITDEYRYAKFENNPLIFELRTDRLADLAIAPAELRDASLARFATAEVTNLTVASKAGPPIVITRKKGNRRAEKDEDKQDRWYVGGVPAESSKVTELIDGLARLEARTTAAAPPPPVPGMPPMPPMPTEKAVVDNPDAKALTEYGLDAAANPTRITVVVQPEVPDGDAIPPAQSFTFVIGKPNAEKKKLPVVLENWPRVNLVDDAIVKLIDRPALAYRGRRPIDTADLELQRLAVKTDSGKAYELIALAADPNRPGANWGLRLPTVADTDGAKSGKLADDLSRLEVTEFIDDAPKPEDLTGKYGFGKPRFVVELGFVGPRPKTERLDIGSEVAGKAEVYARLNQKGGVFTIPKSLADTLGRGAEDLVSLQLWSTTPDRVREITTTKTDQPPFTLKLADGKWSILSSFAATADANALQPMLTALSNLRAEKIEDLATTDVARFGFDKPFVRIKLTYREAKAPGDNVPETDRTRELVIGNVTAPTATSRFAKLVGEASLANAVFVLNPDTILAFDRTPLELLERRLPTIEPASLARITLNGATPESTLTLIRDKDGWKPEGATFPLDRNTTDNFVNSVTRLPVVRLAAFGPNIKWTDYALDKPTHKITLTGSGDKPEIKVIELGKEEATGERYLRVVDAPAVGVISGAGAVQLTLGKLDFVDRSLLSFDPSTLTSLIRKKGAEEFEIGQAGTNWEITRPAKAKADALLVEDLVEQLSRLRAKKVAAFGPADLKPFGLDTPAAVVTLKLGGAKPESRGIRIGSAVNAAQPTSDFYAMLDAAAPQAVAVIPGTLARRLLADPTRFKDRALGGFRGDPDRIVIERGDRKATFVRDGGTWKMTEPAAAEAEQADLDELVNAVAKLRADELVAEKPADAKPFGLDPPVARIRFLTGTNELLGLQIGIKEKDGQRIHARVDKSDLVGLLDPTLSSRVLAEFRKRAVWSGVDASQAATLTVSTGESSFVLRKAAGLWIDADRPEDRIDSAAVSDTLAVLAGLKAERYAADKDADLKLYGLEKPRRVIVVGQPGGTSKVLQIGSEVGGTNGKQAYARVDEKGRTEVFVISEADTQKLLRERAAYLSKK